MFTNLHMKKGTTDSRRADGDAERLITVVMHTMAEEVDALPRPLLRQDVVIVSKAGYIQGTETSPACLRVIWLT